MNTQKRKSEVFKNRNGVSFRYKLKRDGKWHLQSRKRTIWIDEKTQKDSWPDALKHIERLKLLFYAITFGERKEEECRKLK